MEERKKIKPRWKANRARLGWGIGKEGKEGDTRGCTRNYYRLSPPTPSLFPNLSALLPQPPPVLFLPFLILRIWNRLPQSWSRSFGTLGLPPEGWDICLVRLRAWAPRSGVASSGSTAPLQQRKKKRWMFSIMLTSEFVRYPVNYALEKFEFKSTLPHSFFSQESWTDLTGLAVSREQMIMALAAIEAVMIKASYSTRMLQITWVGWSPFCSWSVMWCFVKLPCIWASESRQFEWGTLWKTNSWCEIVKLCLFNRKYSNVLEVTSRPWQLRTYEFRLNFNPFTTKFKSTFSQGLKNNHLPS